MGRRSRQAMPLLGGQTTRGDRSTRASRAAVCHRVGAAVLRAPEPDVRAARRVAGRVTPNDEPRTTNHERRTSNDEPRTTNHERRTSTFAYVRRAFETFRVEASRSVSSLRRKMTVRPAGASLEVDLDRRQDDQDDEGQRCREGRQSKLPGAGRDTDCRVHPDRRGGRHAMNRVAIAHDGAAAKEPDAGDDLTGDSAGVAHTLRHLERHNGEQRRSDGDQDVGAEPRRLLAVLGAPGRAPRRGRPRGASARWNQSACRVILSLSHADQFGAAPFADLLPPHRVVEPLLLDQLVVSSRFDDASALEARRCGARAGSSRAGAQSAR